MACLNSCNCSCGIFTKEAVCMHLLGYSNVHELNICGEEYSKEPDTFATKILKWGTPKKTNRFGVYILRMSKTHNFFKILLGTYRLKSLKFSV